MSLLRKQESIPIDSRLRGNDTAGCGELDPGPFDSLESLPSTPFKGVYAEQSEVLRINSTTEFLSAMLKKTLSLIEQTKNQVTNFLRF